MEGMSPHSRPPGLDYGGVGTEGRTWARDAKLGSSVSVLNCWNVIIIELRGTIIRKREVKYVLFSQDVRSYVWC